MRRAEPSQHNGITSPLFLTWLFVSDPFKSEAQQRFMRFGFLLDSLAAHYRSEKWREES